MKKYLFMGTLLHYLVEEWSLLFEWEKSSEIDYGQDGQKY